jgi:enamine deaminase RidA (YjgF/YER057c/UK114 family)
MERRVINPWAGQDKYEGFAQAVEISGASRTLMCSGQIAVDADGHPVHAGDMRAQLKLALDNLETVLRQAGFTLSDVVRMNFYTTEFDAFLKESRLLTARLVEAGCRPVLTGVGVTRLAFRELMVEIEATAMK